MFHLNCNSSRVKSKQNSNDKTYPWQCIRWQYGDLRWMTSGGKIKEGNEGKGGRMKEVMSGGMHYLLYSFFNVGSLVSPSSVNFLDFPTVSEYWDLSPLFQVNLNLSWHLDYLLINNQKWVKDCSSLGNENTTRIYQQQILRVFTTIYYCWKEIKMERKVSDERLRLATTLAGVATSQALGMKDIPYLRYSDDGKEEGTAHLVASGYYIHRITCLFLFLAFHPLPLSLSFQCNG